MNSRRTAPGSIPSVQVQRAETFVWCVLAAIAVLGHLLIVRGPILSNDGYQYLSVANNFLAGKPATTSIIHFDPERSWGRIPAPLTTFPAGYPLAVAALSAPGIAVEHAALLVSVLAFVLLVPFFVWAARTLELGAGVTRALLVCLIGNSWAAIYATSATTESLFMFTSCAAIILLLCAAAQREPPAERAPAQRPQPSQPGSQRRPWQLLLLASALIGISYWVRYAGVFLFAAASVYCVAQLGFRRDRPSLRAVLCLGLAAAIVAAGFVRNQHLVGSWKGGNTKVVHHPLKEVLREFLIWLHHLFFGGIASARVDALLVLLLLGMVTIVIAAASGARARSWRPQWAWRSGPALLLLCYAAVYCAGMVYLGVTSVISFDTRMFYPLLPVLLLLLGVALSAAARSAAPARGRVTAFYCGLVLMTGAYLGINARSYVAPLAAPHESIERQLNGEIVPGTTLRAWLASNVAPTQVVVANRGQASEYVLQRSTVSLITREYSDQQWDEPALHSLMRTFGAHFLILYTGDAASMAALAESPFLAGLAHGTAPSWLRLATRNHDVLVFRASL